MVGNPPADRLDRGSVLRHRSFNPEWPTRSLINIDNCVVSHIAPFVLEVASPVVVRRRAGNEEGRAERRN
jgi:hypothetical protein